MVLYDLTNFSSTATSAMTKGVTTGLNYIKSKKRAYDAKKKQLHRRSQLIKQWKAPRHSFLSTVRRRLKQNARVRQVRPVHPSIAKAKEEIRQKLLLLQQQASSTSVEPHEDRMTLSSIGYGNNDNVEFHGSVEEREGEQGVLVLDENNINLEDYIQVVKTKGNNGSNALHIATNMLNEGEKPFTHFNWHIKGRNRRPIRCISVYSKELWQLHIVRYLNKENGNLSALYERWAKLPRGKAKNTAMVPILEDLKKQIINHPTMSSSIKAVIIQSQSNVIDDDNCSIDPELAEYVTVVRSNKSCIALHVAANVGMSTSSADSHRPFYLNQKKGGAVTIKCPSLELWKILQPRLSMSKSKLREGIDIDTDSGLSIEQKSLVLQRVRHVDIHDYEYSNLAMHRQYRGSG